MSKRAPSSGPIPATGERFETLVTGGHAKCQWKPDWALRWAALGVDYEMSGKDHIDNVKTSSRICKVLGGNPPDGFNFELFLDENGEKISKSKGNGLTIDEWLTYASPDSLALYMFQKPKTAKRLFFDVIPRAVDEYFAYPREIPDDGCIDQQLTNPVWHIHSGQRAGDPGAGQLLDVAQSGVGQPCPRQGRPLGLHRPAFAWRDAGDASEARRALRLCAGLLPGSGEALRHLPRGRTTRSGRRSPSCAKRSTPCRSPRRGSDIQDTRAVGRAVVPALSRTRPRRAPMADRASASNGSRRSIRCCSARKRDRASASFVELYGLKETVAMIDAALARHARPEPDERNGKDRTRGRRSAPAFLIRPMAASCHRRIGRASPS